jgi:hypothetical protein
MSIEDVKMKLNLDGTREFDGTLKFKAGTKATILFNEDFSTEFNLSYETPDKIDLSLSGKYKLIDTTNFDLDISSRISTDLDGNYIFQGTIVLSFDKNLKIKFNPIYSTEKGTKFVAGLELTF